MNGNSKNGLYFVDDNFKILYYNDAVKEMYPEIEVGGYCYDLIAKRNSVCSNCPMASPKKQNSFYNPHRREYINARVADGELPAFGKFHAITFTSTPSSSPESARSSDTAETRAIYKGLEDSELTGMIGGYCEDGFPLYLADQKMITMLGYDDYDDFEKGIGGMVANTIHPDDMAQVIADIGPEYYEGLEYSTVYRMPKKDGSCFWVIDKGRVIKAEDDRLAIVSVCTDVTDSLKRQELLEAQNDLLQEQNKFMEFVNDGMPGGYHRCAVKDGIPIVYASNKFLDMIGFTREELHNNFDDKFIRLVHPEDLPYLIKSLTDAEKRGTSDLSVHYRILTKNGWLQVVDNTRLSEYNGVKYYQCVIIDINDEENTKQHLDSLNRVQKLLQEALIREQDFRRQLNDLQNEILDSISSGVIAYTIPDYELMISNTALKNMIGCSPVGNVMETVNEFLTQKIIPEDRPQISTAREIVRKSGDMITQDYKAEINGEIRCFHSNIKRLEKTDGQPYILITLTDTTALEQRNAELRDVLDMQTNMADSLGSGIFAYSLPDHKVLILNKEARKMFDCMGSDSSRYGMDIISKIEPDDLPAVRDAEKKLRKSGDSAVYVFHCSTAEGRRSYKCNTKLLSFADGQQYILSSITDITTQERKEKRLDDERRQYREALTLNSKYFFTIDVTEGIVKNQVISSDGTDIFKRLGIELPASYDTAVSVWLSPKRVISSDSDIDIVRSREKLIESYENDTTVIDFEYQTPAENAYYRSLTIIYKIEEHILASFIVYDISENRQEEKQRRSIINSLGHIYSALYHFSLNDDKFTPIKVNARMTGTINSAMTLTEFADVYIENYVTPEFKEQVKGFLSPDSLRKLLAEENSVTEEFKLKDFGWCRVNLVAASRDKKGEVTSVVFAGYAIERQKQAEFAQQEALKAAYESANLANAAKSNFLASMSHDIRTPMNAIIGMTAIAQTHLDDRERVSDCLSKIEISSNHLLGLINEVLDMSKIESGKMELQDEEFNLPELIDNLLTMSKPSITAKFHDLSVLTANIEHEDVIGDSRRIQQVFMNLMSNAVKYTPDGGKISLFISEKPTAAQQAGCYEFIFQDNGIGMSAEFLEHIFEPFTRATDDKQVNNIQGTGLGMSITKNIVQMMNGDIKVESKPNEGTKITVTFFLKLQNAEHDGDYDKLAGLPVLVIDEDETACVNICETLGKLGIKSDWALNMEDAVNKTAARRDNDEGDYFAAIINWSRNNCEYIMKLRERRKRLSADGPIIIVSAYDWSDIEQEARAAGANAFLTKPIFRSRAARLFTDLVGGGHEEKMTESLNDIAHEDFSGKRVLLVEDNPLNAEIAEEILGMAGLTVEHASNGKEAVDIMTEVENDYFSIVFMDVQMPIMNGYEATRAIRSLPRNYTKSVPIIAMTANAFAEDVAAAKSSGMNEHIAKPIDLHQLLRTLKKWLK